MKKEQQTDRIIRNKLKYHASASPDHLWDAIEAELPVDKNDKGAFWWFTGGFLGLALLASLGAFFFYNGTGADQNTLANKDVKAEMTQESLSTSNATVASTETENSESISSQKAVALTKTKSASETSKTTSALANKLITTNEESQKTEISTPLSTEKWIKSAVVEKNIISEATNSKLIVSIPQAAETKVSELSIAKTLESNAFAALDLSSTLIDPFEIEEKEVNWPSLMPAPKCATFGKWLKLHFYGDAYFSPDVAFRKLESKDSDYEGYAKNRKDTESQLLSYSTGLRFSVVSNYGISFRTGIVYSQINEKFRYQNESTERTIIEEVEDENGNLISSDTIVENGTHFITTFNRYRMVDVPLLLGYEVSFKKFSLSINSGIYANLISRQKGNFLSPDLEPVTFSSDARNTYPAFRERLNLSVYGSFAMYYNMNEHWQIMVEPQVRYYLDPLTISNYMVEQKYITTGLITGLRYRF